MLFGSVLDEAFTNKIENYQNNNSREGVQEQQQQQCW